MVRFPNILVAGTPGTGKSATAMAVASQLPQMSHVEIGALVRDKQLHDGWDDELQCYILDEDRICDELEETMERGGALVDFHGADLFPERWFDLVVVLRTDNGVLYPRLEKRGYSQRKLAENMEAEIMQVVLDEARGAYREEIVVELTSNDIEGLESNVARIVAWINEWCANEAATQRATTT
mmetsp:Transcript_54381/g.125291  ORF Transcript_54381/g.125291 Transcript_54381/m.125291 type:complete len:182 (-) Transcript_54381:445-990(-)